MKVTGATYDIEGEKYLVIYRYQKDVLLKLPPEIESENIAHLTYKKRNKDGSAYVFKLKNFNNLEKYVTLSKDFQVKDGRCIISGKIHNNHSETKPHKTPKKGTRSIYIPNREEVMRKYDISGQTVFSGNKKDELELLFLGDVLDFCKDQEVENENEWGIKTVGEIIAKTKLKKIEPERILQGGKQDFVYKCWLEANIDYNGDCITRFVPGANASFDGTYFYNYFSFPWGECEYCYSEAKHGKKGGFPKEMYDFTKQRLTEEIKGGCKLIHNSEETLGRPVKMLRFGKRTESWTPFTKDKFSETLEVMVDVGTRGVIPTKLLPFDPFLAKLFRGTNSTLLYGVSPFSKFEFGAVEIYGSTNEWRMEQARKYAEAGVDSQYYLLCAANLPPGEFEKKVLADAERNKMIVQVLPLRHKNKDLCFRMTGENWDFLKNKHPNQEKLFLKENEASYIYFDNQLVLKKIHPEWEKIIGNNRGRVKMCHHDDYTIYCGGCSAKGGGIFKNGKHNRKDLEKKPKKRKKSRKPKKEEDPNQKKLFKDL